MLIIWIGRFGAACVISLSILSSALTAADAQEDRLVGTWKLRSFVREVAGTSERYDQLGPKPNGYISYSPDGRMYAFLLAGDRPKPKVGAETDTERLELYKTMIAYGGTYTADGAKVVHHVDISWNGAYTGTDQLRFYNLDGDELTIKTAPNKSPVDGREGVGVLVFDRVK